MQSKLRKLASEMSESIDLWLIEGENEFHPGYDKRYTPDINSRRFQLYRKLNRLLPLRDFFTERKILHVGAATGAYNFVLRASNPSKLIVLEPDADNFQFLSQSKNISYDDHINLRLEDVPKLDRNDFDLVFLGNLPVTDWVTTIKMLTSLTNVVDIVIQSKMFKCEIEHTKYVISSEIRHPSRESKKRYGTWSLAEETEMWSIGEIMRVARDNGFATVHREYIKTSNPIGWCTLVFSRLD